MYSAGRGHNAINLGAKRVLQLTMHAKEEVSISHRWKNGKQANTR